MGWRPVGPDRLHLGQNRGGRHSLNLLQESRRVRLQGAVGGWGFFKGEGEELPETSGTFPVLVTACLSKAHWLVRALGILTWVRSWACVDSAKGSLWTLSPFLRSSLPA